MDYVFKRIGNDDKKLIIECDKLLQKLIMEDSKYDNNYNTNIKLNSLEEDLKNINNYIIVALNNNNVIGFIYGNITNKKYEKETTAKLLFLYVLEEYRNQNIGKSLINKLNQLLKEDDIKYLDVQVYSKNKKAINLYNNLEFNDYTLNLRKEIK